MPKITVNGQTVQTGELSQTNGRTHTHTHADATKRIISPAAWSIKIKKRRKNIGNIYSPVGKFAERAKERKQQ